MFLSKPSKTSPSKPPKRPAVSQDIHEELKLFLAEHGENADPSGPTWTKSRFIGQAIQEKIFREREKNILSHAMETGEE